MKDPLPKKKKKNLDFNQFNSLRFDSQLHQPKLICGSTNFLLPGGVNGPKSNNVCMTSIAKATEDRGLVNQRLHSPLKILQHRFENIA